jgi:hypothetical protein
MNREVTATPEGQRDIPSDMDTLKRDVTNRRMRKTARTVV